MNGLLYVATGAPHFAEAIRSAKTAKSAMPNTPIAIVSDQPDVPDFFDQVIFIAHTGNGFVDKIQGMLKSPFERTIFLDTDTLIVEPFSELFDLLDQYDVAVAAAPGYKGFPENGIPESFYELNTGVVAYALSEQVTTAFEEWETAYREGIKTHAGEDYFFSDQPIFRRVLWNYRLATYILPPEYNFRTVLPSFARSRVKVFHGRHLDFDNIISLVNDQVGDRVIPEYPRVFPRFPYDALYNAEDIQFASPGAQAQFVPSSEDDAARDRKIREALNQGITAFNSGDPGPITKATRSLLLGEMDYLAEPSSIDIVKLLRSIFGDQNPLDDRCSLLLDMLMTWHQNRAT